MQDPLRPAQQVGFAREVEPQQPVPLQRQARRTERIGTRRDVAVGQEPTAARTAHGAFAAAPHVEKARDRHRPPCKALQEGPRHMVERPTDQPLHSPVIFFHVGLGLQEPFAAEGDERRGAPDLGGQRVDRHLLVAEFGEDGLDLGHRFVIGEFLFYPSFYRFFFVHATTAACTSPSASVMSSRSPGESPSALRNASPPRRTTANPRRSTRSTE